MSKVQKGTSSPVLHSRQILFFVNKSIFLQSVHVSKFLDIFSHKKDLNKLLDVLGHLFGSGITILPSFA